MKYSCMMLMVAVLAVPSLSQAAGGGGDIKSDPGAMTGKHFHPKGKLPSEHTLKVLKQAKDTLPFSDTRDFEEQKKGFIAAPGLAAWAPGRMVIMWPPVSVCHQVSTIGQVPPPTTSLYQFHASGLIGSPTVPRTLSVLRSCLRTSSGPCAMSARMAVGAV